MNEMYSEPIERTLDEVMDKTLITPYRKFPTTVQDTLLRLIKERLQELYSKTQEFSDKILNPQEDRLDIIRAKAAQYDYDIDVEWSISEQIKLINAINTINSKRGSIESIEDMWKYFGKGLPKDIKITNPAESLFRYSISSFSGTHRFQDGSYYRAGVFNIEIYEDYDYDRIKEFVYNELLTAGTTVNFNKIISYSKDDYDSDLTYKYDITNSLYNLEISPFIQMFSRGGLLWSSASESFKLSGNESLLFWIVRSHDFDPIKYQFNVSESIIEADIFENPLVRFFSCSNIITDNKFDIELDELNIEGFKANPISIRFYDEEGVEILPHEKYPGYFILGETKLKEVIIRDES